MRVEGRVFHIDFVDFSPPRYFFQITFSFLCFFIYFVITHFWVTPKFFPFLQKKKKNLHGAVLNDTVQLLLRCTCRGKEEEDFKSFFPLSLSTPLAQKTRMTHTHTTIPRKHYGRKMRRRPMPCT